MDSLAVVSSLEGIVTKKKRKPDIDLFTDDRTLSLNDELFANSHVSAERACCDCRVFVRLGVHDTVQK